MSRARFALGMLVLVTMLVGVVMIMIVMMLDYAAMRFAIDVDREHSRGALVVEFRDQFGFG